MQIALDPTTKKAALYSGIIHLSALFMVVVGLVFSRFFINPPEPYIFEMVALPDASSVFESEPVIDEPIPDLSIDVPEFEVLPEPKVEPKIEPKPVEVVRRPKPKPVEVVKPKPVPVKKPEIISYDEFVKQQGKPVAAKQVKRQPSKPHEIDTSKIERNLSNISVPELSMNSSVSADSSAMDRWNSLLFSRIQAAWNRIAPSGMSNRRAKVEFSVSVGGGISAVRIISSSGNSEFDRRVIDAVRSLGVVQSPPGGQRVSRSIWIELD